MISLINRMLFWSRANNRHGIHSPFVYNFLDRSLYRSEDRGAPPAERLLLAAIRHYKPARMGCAAHSPWKKHLKACGTGTVVTAPPYDLYAMDRPGPELATWIGQPGNWHNDTVLFVGGLGEGGRMDPSWQDCLEPGPVRICLETYPAALLFFRREQAPEHFRIRI